MPLDTFICGTCQDSFTDLNEFVTHKQTGCSTNQQTPSSTAPAAPQPPPAPPPQSSGITSQGSEVFRLHLNESGEITAMTPLPIGEEDNLGNGSTLAFLNDVSMGGDFVGSNLESNGSSGVQDTNTGQTLIILNNAEGTLTSELNNGGLTLQGLEGLANQVAGELVSVGNNGATAGQLKVEFPGQANVPTSATVTPTSQQLIQQPSLSTADSTATSQGETEAEHPPVKKRRGRSKNGEGKIRIMEAVPPTVAKPTEPETTSDGKLSCPQCKRTFSKLRYFTTHKCLATSSYVDITKKEVLKLDSGDDEDVLDQELDAGALEEEDGEEFSARHSEKLTEKEDEEDEKEMDREDVEDEENIRKKRRKRRRKFMGEGSVTVDATCHETGAQQVKAAADSMENVPIFRNEEEREAFEACVDVDLSEQVDHMFRIHLIEQELNEMSGMVYNTPTMSSLSVYSCNVCEKVFKSLSHIRLHCITHTDSKPFQCSKCSYATNSKGNLYTHMRKHTGQYYRCDKCEFKTVNKSHLIEHQMTHDNRRSQCLICLKDYSTLKSLINHVRKYHTDPKGKEYLQSFLQGRSTKGTTIIHQCHVCNRKFKKRIDRDRHLFIHDIKDLPHVKQCELCDYWASRKVYLNKHYLKHRVIYCCVFCDQKFLSTIRLTEHLSTEHCNKGEGGAMVTDYLLQDCINKSLYLPEPLAIKHGNKYVNLPGELCDENKAPNSEPTLDTREVTPDALSPQAELDQAAKTLDKEVGSPKNDEQPHPPEISVKAHTPNLEAAADPTSHGNVTQSSEITISNVRSVKGEELKQEVLAEGEAIPSQVATQAVTEVSGSSETVALKQTGALLKKEVAEENSLDPTSTDAGETPSEQLMLQNPGSPDTEEHIEGVGGDESTQEIAQVRMIDDIEEDLEEPEEEEEEEEDKMETDAEEFEDKPTEETADSLEPDLPHPALVEGDNEEASQEGNGEAGPEEEAGVSAEEQSKEEKISALINRLGYRQMSMDIFNKMRNAFGTEECEYCGRLFFSKADYEPHVRTHTCDKPFACSNCSFRANTKEQLKRHSEKEHEKIAFQCKECDFLAPTRTRLWNHQLKHLGISGLSCPKCPSKFDGMKQLRAHILNQHQDIDKATLEKLTGYKHRPLGKMGRKSFKCPHCPRTFIRANSDLQKHIWIHEGIKPFSCPICPYACRSKNNLQAHMLRHSTEKPFSCSECGKEYKSKTALRWHVRSHKHGKPFKCDKCPYEATQSSHLKRHMETHDVLKRFVCKHCEFSSNTLGYMKIHYARHHKGKPFAHDETGEQSTPQTEKRIFKCLSCGYLFGNLSDLKRHLKIRHHVQMQAIAGMEQMQISEVEVVQYDDATKSVVSSIPYSHDSSQMSQSAQVATSGELQSTVSTEETKAPISAVNLIQQIFSMSQGENQVRVVSEDGEPLELGPETIIVQDGQLVLGGDASSVAGTQPRQFVIQYYNPAEMQTEASSGNVETRNLPLPAPASSTVQLVTTSDLSADQPTNQYIISPEVHAQIMNSANPQPQLLPPTETSQPQILHSETSNGTAGQLIAIEGETTTELMTSTDGDNGQFVVGGAELDPLNEHMIISDSNDHGQALVIEDDVETAHLDVADSSVT